MNSVGVYKNYTADYKFFQEHQQKSRRFPVFPGGISNSRKFPVFPGVADTLNKHLDVSTSIRGLHSWRLLSWLCNMK